MTVASTPEGWRARLIRQCGRLQNAVAALDQMALSVFTFGLNIVLVRALTATEFGIVSLWIAMAFLAGSIQNALVNVPLNVHLPSITDPVRARRLEEAVAVVIMLAVGLTVVVVLAFNAWSNAEWAPHNIATALAIPLFMGGGMYREYSRTLAFSRRSTPMLLWIDGAYLAVTTLCLAAMLIWPAYLANLAVAFFAMSIGCIVSQVCLRWRFAIPKPRPFSTNWVGDYRSVMGDVRWALLGVFAAHLQSRCYVYVSVNLVSLAGLASISVVGILFRPVRILLHGWTRSAQPNMAAQLVNGDLKGFDREFLRGFAAAIIGSVAWFGVLAAAWQPIQHYFLTDRYPDAWSLMWPWFVAAALDVMVFIVTMALQAAREFRYLACATVVTAPISLAASAVAVLLDGYTWTMYGVAAGSFAMLLIAGHRLYQVRIRIASGAGLPAALASAAAEGAGH
jgi:O-antigen/teichoic acid export membrane protein